MQLDPLLLAGVFAALGAAQACLWALARLLGARLRREAIAAGLLLPFAVLWPWLSSDRLLAPTQALAGQVPGTVLPAVQEPHAVELNDAVFQLLPWELEVRRAWSAGRLPFWSDRVDGGSALWANPQAAVLSPVAMAARLLPIRHHFLATLALEILIALQGAWLLGRLLGMRRWVALVVGVSFALGGAIMAWALFPLAAAAAWSPWCVAGALALARHALAVRARILGTAVAFAALLLSGHPEVAAATGALAIVVAVSFARRRRRTGALLRVAIAATLGAGLAAPVLVPFLDLLPRSQRAHEHLQRAAASDEEESALTRPWFRQNKGPRLLAPANPLVFGTPYGGPPKNAVEWTPSVTAYGGLAVFLGCWLLVAARRRLLGLPFVAFAVIVMLLGAEFLPLTRLWFLLAPLRLPEYSRFVPVATLALAMAGGLGLESLSRGVRRWPGAAAAIVACGVSCALAPRWEIALPWLLLLVATGLQSRRRVSGLLLLLAVVADLLPWARRLLPPGDPASFYPRTPEVQAIMRETPAAYRAVGQDLLSYSSLLPFYGVAEPRPHNPLAPSDYLRTLRAAFGFSPSTAEYHSPLRTLDHPLRRFLGVRTMVSNPYLPAPAGAKVLPGWDQGPTRLYVDTKALPRLFAARAADTIARDGVEAWIASMENPKRVAVFADEIGDRPLPRRLTEKPIEIVRLEPGAIDLRVPPGGVKLVATSIPGPRGWRVWGGGRPLRRLTVNGAFLGFVVPGRMEEVHLRYRPPGLVGGLVAAGVCALALAALAVLPAAWLRPWSARRQRDGFLLVAALVVALALGNNLRALVAYRAAGAKPYPRSPVLWRWGTAPPEAVRALVAAAEPRLPPGPCTVGFAGPWSGADQFFPPLWAAYFLPRCDVVPLASAGAAGPELRILMGDVPAGAAVERLAPLPGGGLYRRRP